MNGGNRLSFISPEAIRDRHLTSRPLGIPQISHRARARRILRLVSGSAQVLRPCHLFPTWQCESAIPPHCHPLFALLPTRCASCFLFSAARKRCRVLSPDAMRQRSTSLRDFKFPVIYCIINSMVSQYHVNCTFRFVPCPTQLFVSFTPSCATGKAKLAKLSLGLLCFALDHEASVV